MDIFVGSSHCALSGCHHDLVYAYNHSRHRSIGIAPADVQNKTRTVFGCAFSGTAIPTLNLKFRRDPWCGQAATKQILTRATYSTGENSTLQSVRRCHLERRRSDAYISWWIITMNLWKAGYPEELENNFRQPVPHRKKSWEGALYLTIQKLFVLCEGSPNKYNSWINETDRYDVGTE